MIFHRKTTREYAVVDWMEIHRITLKFKEQIQTNTKLLSEAKIV